MMRIRTAACVDCFVVRVELLMKLAWLHCPVSTSISSFRDVFVGLSPPPSLLIDALFTCISVARF
eukprot:m.73683 g.73683  ORF g.73683 m.73683 type:complete len:65 (+) comp12372_c0_seq2:1159-1353(+)